MPSLRTNIGKLYAFSFLQMSLFPMAIITLFWKDRIGLSLTEILLLQGIFAVAMVIMEYPSGYLSDRIGYRRALNYAALLGVIGWGLYTVADSFGEVLVAEIILGISLSFISGSDSALLFESLKGTDEEPHYARHQGRVNGSGQLGEACGALFAGLLYAAAPLLPFLIQVAVWVLIFFLTRTLVDPPRTTTPVSSHLAEADRRPVPNPLPLYRKQELLCMPRVARQAEILTEPVSGLLGGIGVTPVNGSGRGIRLRRFPGHPHFLEGVRSPVEGLGRIPGQVELAERLGEPAGPEKTPGEHGPYTADTRGIREFLEEDEA
ncbi:MAG: MFS transporter, partial [Proteobacteria bacterium]|nr:MFS transporter [Pseudomonadota bacterium]